MNILLIGMIVLAVIISFVLVRFSYNKLLVHLILTIAGIIGLFVFVQVYSGNGIEAAKMIAPSKSSGAFSLAYSYLIACLVSLLVKMVLPENDN